jgi:hypothetical protein
VQFPLQQSLQASLYRPKEYPDGMQAAWAFPFFASPKQARTIPARPTPNFLKACRRVTDCAMLFASSSNLVVHVFLSFGLGFS